MASLRSKSLSSSDRSNWPVVAAIGCMVVVGAAGAVIYSQRRNSRRKDDDGDDDNRLRSTSSSDVSVVTKVNKESNVKPLPSASTNNRNVSSFLSLLPSHLQHQFHKEERRRAKLPWLTRKTPLYDNIHMLDPTGHLLCNVSRKKANWYLRKGLAKWTDDVNHISIQLLFTPQGGFERGTTATNRIDNDSSSSIQQKTKRLYTTSVKQNICVVCGDSHNLIRHYVVPLSYRKLFPHHFKSHQPHDIVLLCADCHMASDQAYQERMQELDQQHRPVDEDVRHTAVSHFIDDHLTKIQSYALALLRYRAQMPPERIQDYEYYLLQHLQQLAQQTSQDDQATLLTTDQLEVLSRIDVRVTNEHYIPGANLVVEAMASDNEQITNFILDWRRFFVEHLRPQFLPIGWSIESPVVSDTRVKS